jgi:uncharacterized OsmC-like protein
MNGEVNVRKIEVRIIRETLEGSPWRTSFAVRVDLGAGLTRREQAILYNAARRCEVHQLLTGEVRLEYELMGAQPLARPPAE